MTGSGAVAGPTVTMPAMSQATVFPSATLGAADFSTKVECTDGQAISVDRTMYWTGTHLNRGRGPLRHRGHLPRYHLVHAGRLQSNWGFECFVLIQNPGDAPTEATVTWMIEGGSPQATNVTVGATSRSTLNMADYIGAADASIKVESDSAVICERAMYRNDRREGHDSGGTPTAAADYYLAEGCTGFGFTTYVLVQNPNHTPTDVEITYQAASGPVAGPAFTMPANSRKTINVNDTTAIPGPDPSFSTHVHGDQPHHRRAGHVLERGRRQRPGLPRLHRPVRPPHHLVPGRRPDLRRKGDLDPGPEPQRLRRHRAGHLHDPGWIGQRGQGRDHPGRLPQTFNMAEHSGITGGPAIMVGTVGSATR